MKLSLFMDRSLNQSEIQHNILSDTGAVLQNAVSIVLYMLTCGAVLLTVCGNLLVIISICHFKQLHTPTNLLLLSLAVTDLLIGLTIMPFHFALLVDSCWRFGINLCKFYKVCCTSLSSISAYNVTFIAVDRYLAVRDPFVYAAKITVNLTLFLISLIWSLCILYNLALLYFNRNFDNIKNNTVCSVECIIPIDEAWGIIDLVSTFVIPCSVMIILYMNIFAIAKKHVVNISKQQSKDRRKMNSSALSERKAAQKLGILVLVFLLCFIPYYICVFASFSVKYSISDIITKVASLMFINSSINPIIYALFYPWFQKCVKIILTFQLHKPESALVDVLTKKY